MSLHITYFVEVMSTSTVVGVAHHSHCQYCIRLQLHITSICCQHRVLNYPATGTFRDVAIGGKMFRLKRSFADTIPECGAEQYEYHSAS